MPLLLNALMPCIPFMTECSSASRQTHIAHITTQQEFIPTTTPTSAPVSVQKPQTNPNTNQKSTQEAIKKTSPTPKNTQSKESFPKSNTCVKHPKVHVFMYHYIREHAPQDPPVIQELSVPPAKFDDQMKAVASLKNADKIDILTGEEFLAALKTECFPHKNIWIFTSDDGWLDNFYELAPIAEKYQIPFIFGIVSGNIHTPWFVGEREIKILSDNPLFTIASHSVTHAALNYGPINKAKSEICDSKKQLETITGKNIDLFIYPYGKIGRNSIRFLKECGYSAAWSTDQGAYLNWKSPNFFNMNRIHIWPRTTPEFFEKLAK